MREKRGRRAVADPDPATSPPQRWRRTTKHRGTSTLHLYRVISSRRAMLALTRQVGPPCGEVVYFAFTSRAGSYDFRHAIGRPNYLVKPSIALLIEIMRYMEIAICRSSARYGTSCPVNCGLLSVIYDKRQMLLHKRHRLFGAYAGFRILFLI